MQDAGLNSGTIGNHFVRVYAFMRFLAEEVLDRFQHFRHTGHPADHDNIINFAGFQAGIFQCRLYRFNRTLDQVLDKTFELGARHLDVQMFRAGRIRRDKGQVHFRLAG